MNNKGQVLLLSVMVLSGVIISVSLFVGYLMIQRLRQANIAIDSAQAFYLSDAGIEYELYRLDLAKKNKENKDPNCPQNSSDLSYFTTRTTIEGDPKSNSVLGVVIKSTGYVGAAGKQTTRSQQDSSQGVDTSRYIEEPALFNNRGCDQAGF